MRGKHDRARARREAAALSGLQAEIEAETARAATAKWGAEKTRTARNRLSVEQRRTADRLRPEIDQAAAIVAEVGPAVERVHAALAALRRAELRLGDRRDHNALRQMAGAGARLELSQVHRSAGREFRETWYRAKTGKSIDFSMGIPVPHWTPADVPHDRESLAPYIQSTVHDTAPQARYAWAVPPWLRPPTDGADAPALRAKLGSTHTGAPRLATSPNPPPIRARATINMPWRHLPMIGEPADAADLAYWYARSADAQGWTAGTAPVPFLLPAEQRFGYPHGEPLPADAPLRLPYPAIFVGFATPWELPASPGDADALDDSLRTFVFYARGRAARSRPETLERVLRRLNAIPNFDRSDLPTPLEMVRQYGGTVEGLILTADDEGKPSDQFAWCIAIPLPDGFFAGRITVPANVHKTTWRTQVQNVIAGIALSCWHQPLDPITPVPGQRTATRSAEGVLVDLDVRILDIDATSPPRRTEHYRRQGRSTRAHIRRGHWRRQRTGHGRTETHWRWIRPTTVSGTRQMATPVYVLP